MRRAILMLGVLVLAACQMTTPAKTPSGPVAVPSPIVGDVLAAAALPRDDDPLAALEPIADSTATGATPTETAPEEVIPEAAKTPEQIDCEKTKGRWSRVGANQSQACVHITRDSGKQCRRDRDCESVCLARSGTCAPVTPLFGCNEVLQDDGRRMTQCLD